MRKFVYLIGTAEDFESIEDLKACYFDPSNSRFNESNADCMSVNLSEACVVQGYDSLEEIAIAIARGEAMAGGWCLDGTYSLLLEV